MTTGSPPVVFGFLLLGEGAKEVTKLFSWNGFLKVQMFSVNVETSTLNEAMNVCLIALQNIYQIPDFQHFLFPLVPLTNAHKLADLKYRFVFIFKHV